MSQDTELQKLEQFVEKLLKNFSELREEKKQLEQTLKTREAQIDELQSNITTNDNERTEISSRVNKLIDQIEDWEQGLDESSVDDEEEEDAEEEPEPGETQNELQQEDEIEEDGVEEEEEASDEEGRVQHNLFSMS